MKVLVPVDGSAQSDRAIDDVAGRPWPPGTAVEVLTVVHARTPLLPDPAFMMAAIHVERTEESREHAPDLVNSAAGRIRDRAPQAQVTTRILEGPPTDVILKEADEWGADLIVLGSHGRSGLRKVVLGSVASGVAADAPCAVEIIKAAREPVSVRSAT